MVFVLTVLQSQQHVLVCAALIYVYALYLLRAAGCLEESGRLILRVRYSKRSPIGCRQSIQHVELPWLYSIQCMGCTQHHPT